MVGRGPRQRNGKGLGGYEGEIEKSEFFVHNIKGFVVLFNNFF